MLRRAHGLALDIPEPFDRSRSLCRIGSLLTDLDARDEAISTFDQALAIGPKSWTAGNALQGLLRLGQKEKLVQALRDGLQEAKNQPNPLARVSAFIHLASLFIKAEDYEDAASALEQGTQALGEALPSVQATSTPTQRALHLDDIISSIKAMMQLVPSS
jgi:tetratricopeptide (TPR) repeat protein